MFEDVWSIHRKFKIIYSGWISISDTPKKSINNDNFESSNEFESYSYLEDLKTIMKKTRNLSNACILFTEHPVRKTQDSSHGMTSL